MQVAPAICELAALRRTLLYRLERATAECTTPPLFGALFGSAARGDMRSGSDLDIYLVRPDGAEDAQWDSDVTELARRATMWTGNDARIIDEGAAEIHGTPLTRAIAEEGISFVGSARAARP